MSQKQYERALNASIAERDRLISLYEREIKKVYKEVYSNTAFNLRSVSESEWQIEKLRMLMDRVDQNTREAYLLLNRTYQSNLNDMFEYTDDISDVLYGRMGLTYPRIVLSPDILDNQRLLLNKLVTDLSTDLTNRVSTTVAFGVQSGKSTLAVAKDINNQFDISFSRAKKISDTEMLRTHSITTYENDKEFVKSNPQLKKVWRSTHKPRARLDHIDIESITMANPIPGNGLFNVNGVMVPYPRHAALPAKDTVNCSCYTQLIEPEK
jgi:hypothetical protein